MKLKKNCIQIVSGGVLAMLILCTFLMARYGEHLPRPLSEGNIMVALGVRTHQTL